MHDFFSIKFRKPATDSASQDIYDSRGYAVRKDWVNGPNKVFRFILQSSLDCNRRIPTSSERLQHPGTLPNKQAALHDFFEGLGHRLLGEIVRV